MAYEVRLVLQGLYDAEGYQRGQEAVPKLMRLGARDAGPNRKTTPAAGLCYQDVRRSLGGNLCSLDSRYDDRLHRGLNSLFAAVKRKDRGCRTVEYVTAILYLVAVQLTLPCH